MFGVRTAVVFCFLAPAASFCCQRQLPLSLSVELLLGQRSDAIPLILSFDIKKDKFMAHKSKNSKRVVKLKRNEDYAYDETLNFLATATDRGSILRHESPNNSSSAPNVKVNLDAGNSHFAWSELNYLPVSLDQIVSTTGNDTPSDKVLATGSRSLVQFQDELDTDDSSLFCFEKDG